MHAMLGLAASHLDIYGGNFSSQALNHRIKAIQSLNQALSTPPKSTAEGDARFAAMFALTFQASCMPEGMNEFLAMIRGCHIVYNTSMTEFQDSLFQAFTQAGYSDSVRQLIKGPPIILDEDQDILIKGFIKSLRALAPLCKSPLEIKFMAATERVVRVARVSAAEGQLLTLLSLTLQKLTLFLAFAGIVDNYTIINHASHEEFAPFLDPEAYPAQLLLIHFILIEFAIGHMALGPMGSRFAFRKRSCIAWMLRLAAGLPEEYQKYAEWPMNFVKQLQALCSYHGVKT